MKKFSYKYSVISSSNEGFGTELEEVLDVISKQSLYDKSKLKNFF